MGFKVGNPMSKSMTKSTFLKPPNVRIEKFQCPSARGLPEDFKTHPTFIPSANFVGVMAVLNMGAFFLGHPVLS